jgi:hypothetical protein
VIVLILLTLSILLAEYVPLCTLHYENGLQYEPKRRAYYKYGFMQNKPFSWQSSGEVFHLVVSNPVDLLHVRRLLIAGYNHIDECHSRPYDQSYREDVVLVEG